VKRLLFTVILLGVCGSSSFAQTPAGTQHNIVWTWTAPSPVGGSGTIAGYNYYRAPGGTTTFVKMNTAVITTTSYTDLAVVAGTQYTACVTTVDSAGNESVCSTAVTVTVPTNPNAPSALQGIAHSGEYKRLRRHRILD
jgi:fibronectin type 3 domain-containing protein